MPEVEITTEQRSAIRVWLEGEDLQGKKRGALQDFRRVGLLVREVYLIDRGSRIVYLMLLGNNTRPELGLTDSSWPLKLFCSDDVVARQLEEAGLVNFPKPEIKS